MILGHGNRYCTAINNLYVWQIITTVMKTMNSVRFRASSRLDREYLGNATRHRRSENSLQTTDTPAQANLIRCTLVHKRQKIRPEFWPTQKADFRLGNATLMPRLYSSMLGISDRWLTDWVVYCTSFQIQIKTWQHRNTHTRKKLN